MWHFPIVPRLFAARSSDFRLWLVDCDPIVPRQFFFLFSSPTPVHYTQRQMNFPRAFSQPKLSALCFDLCLVARWMLMERRLINNNFTTLSRSGAKYFRLFPPSDAIFYSVDQSRLMNFKSFAPELKFQSTRKPFLHRDRCERLEKLKAQGFRGENLLYEELFWQRKNVSKFLFEHPLLPESSKTR